MEVYPWPRSDLPLRHPVHGTAPTRMEGHEIRTTKTSAQIVRLKGYDYSQPGGYFVTIVAQNRECLFGEIVEGEMRLSRAGRIVQHAWMDLPNHYADVVLDEFVIMPNHVHGIIILTEMGRGGRGRSVSGGIVLPDQDRDSMGPVPDLDQTCPYIGEIVLPDRDRDSIEPVPDTDQTCPYTIDKSTRPYNPRPGTRHGLPEIVRAFKSFSARRIKQCGGSMPCAGPLADRYGNGIITNES
ncbi:MAG TPA: hypothetical protein VI755_13485 [Anaerolineales bacterium]|nr:hypothetical protein [Anaerolineales bacterium]